MRTKIYIRWSLCIALTMGLCSAAAAQRKANVKTADKLFDRFLYKEAIDRYENIRKKDDHVLRQLGAAYLLTGDSKNAEKNYAELYKKGTATGQDLMQYASALKMNGKYTEAQQMLEASSLNSDTRVTASLKDKTYYTRLQQDKGQFAIRNLKLNTAESDFGTSYYGNRVVFVSSRPRLSFTSYEYNWNAKNFLDLYSFLPHDRDKSAVKKVRRLQGRGRLNKQFHEGPATFNAEGNLMIFTRDRYTKKKELNKNGERVLELWYCEKDAKGKWNAPKPMPFNNAEYSVGHASLSPDGQTLWFASNMPGGMGSSDIYYSKRNTDGSWGAPVNAGSNVNTEGKEMFPSVHGKGILFFASEGRPGLGGLDVFMARVLPNGSTGAATNLGAPVNGPKDDFAFVLSNDMKGGYFSSNRDGGKGSDDIYAYDLLIPFRLTRRIEGYVMDKNNNALLLAGSTVVLKDASGNIAGTVQADDKGFYSFEAEPDQEFFIQGSNANYNSATVKASTGGNDDVVQADLQLEKIPQISLACFVSDQKSGQPLSGTRIIIRDKSTGKELVNATTGADGFFREALENAKLSDQLSYTISLEHDGYLSKNLNFAYTITKEGEIKVHEQLDLTMGKIEIGTDIGKLIDIRPIYFDLGKSNIRTDASVELDKIVAIMKQYPTMVIELGSHTDCRSSKTSNEALSNKRAQASANYIISKGIDKSRIYGKGYGESKPVNGCICEGAVKSDCSEEEHQKNRRTEFIVVKM